MKISIIIPAYNEENVIGSTIIETSDYFSRQAFDYEIIVVDDGSKDRTAEKVERLQGKYSKLRLLKNGSNRGKGGAVRTGMLQGSGDYLLFMDADLSTPITEFIKFMPNIQAGTDVVIGTRKKKGANITRRQPLLREYMGKMFTWVSNILLGCTVSDYTCGFKVFSCQAAKNIFSRQLIDGWGYDSEIIFLARKKGYDIKEIPVTWHNDGDTKVRLVRDSVNSFIELIRIRINYIKNRYA